MSTLAADSIIAEGKTKRLTPGKNGQEIRVTFKDDATAFNALKHEVVEGKGALNAQISRILFELLQAHGLPTCFIRAGQADNELVYQPLTMIPLEVVVRNVALGSYVKRYGVTEGQALNPPVVECFYKSADDPLITPSVIEALSLLPAGLEYHHLETLALSANEVLVRFFAEHNIQCADFKLEFGTTAKGQLTIGDELSPDNFRLRDKDSGQVLDKDVFRLDLADLKTTYATLLARIQKKGSSPTAVKEGLNTYQAVVEVSTRKNVFSPESQTILDSLGTMGYLNVKRLQAGKRFVITLQSESMQAAEAEINTMADQLLANPVIEDFTYRIAYAPVASTPNPQEQ